MINPFISIDQQLEDVGWKKLYETQNGFGYARKISSEIAMKAEGVYVYDTFCFGCYDPSSVYRTTYLINEHDMRLFTAKIKEWRKQYGRPDKSK